MERTGILHVNPSADLLPKAEDPVKRSLALSEGIYNLFGKHYENKLASQKAQLGERTMEGQINATNAKNNADTIYYPQLKEAELGHMQAQIKEVMSKTGLNYAEAKAAVARASSSYAEAGLHRARANEVNRGETSQEKLFRAYQNAPAGSEQKAYLGAILNKETSGHMLYGGGQVPGTPSGGAVPQAQGGAVPSGMDINSGIPYSLERNQMGSKRGAGQYNVPQAGVTGEGPTQASMTRDQVRDEATAEIKAIEPTLKAQQPYMGAGGSAKLAYDGYLSRTQPNTEKGKAAIERLIKWNTFEKLKREAANLISKQSSGQAPGVEAAREQEKASFGGGPYKFGNYLTSPEVLKKAQDQYFVDQEKIANVAINKERQNYPIKNETNPIWAQGQQGSGGGFGAYGYEKPQAGGGFSGNPNVQPEQPNPNAAQESNLKPAQAKQEQEIYYNEMAAQAIKAGADPEKVKARLAQLRGGG